MLFRHWSAGTGGGLQMPERPADAMNGPHAGGDQRGSAITCADAQPMVIGLKWTARAAGLLGAMLAFSASAHAEMEPPPAEPFLRIETGTHNAAIRGLGIDASCRLMLTGSGDKTGRLWALPESASGKPKLLMCCGCRSGWAKTASPRCRGFRPTAGWPSWAGGTPENNNDGIYVFDTATGKLARRLPDVNYTTLHLTFSPDGRYLAAALGIGGVRVWETTGWRLVGKDNDYNGQRSNGASFDANGTLYTVAYDGFIRRYDRDFKLDMKAMTEGKRSPTASRSIPRAIGSRSAFKTATTSRSTTPRAWSVSSPPIRERARDSTLSQVAWSADRARLYAGGSYSAQDWTQLRMWEDEGRGSWRDLPLAQHSIKQILPCRDTLAVSTSDPAFGLVSLDGKKRNWQDAAAPDMHGKAGRSAYTSSDPGLTVSADGSRVRFGLGYGSERPFLFDIASGERTTGCATSAVCPRPIFRASS